MAEFKTLTSHLSNSFNKENFDTQGTNLSKQTNQCLKNKNQTLLRSSIKRLSSIENEYYSYPAQHLKESIFLHRKTFQY